MDTNSNSKTTKNTIDEKTKKLFQKWFWGLFGGILCLIAIIFFLISVGLVGYVPPLEELENPKNKLATEIYSSDNQVLGTFYSGKDNRMKIRRAFAKPYQRTDSYRRHTFLQTLGRRR